MAEEEDQGREIPALMRSGKNVAKPPLKPTKDTPEGGPKGIHSEEEDDEEDKPKRLKDVYKKTRLAGDVLRFPPSARTPAGRKQIRDEIKTGKEKYESGLKGSKKGPISIEDIKSAVDDDE